MARGGLFSTYRSGENRVTASMLAVFERSDIARLEKILAAASGETSLQLVSFDNQPGAGGGTVPDARIAGNFALWFETKTARNAVRPDQLVGHLEHFDNRPGVFERLFVVTPDSEEPQAITDLNDERIIWFSFRDLSFAIDELLTDTQEVISEREELLFRELQTLFEEDDLVGFAQDVVVVAASRAYDEYLESHAYVCQARRAFQPVDFIGFYRTKRIEPSVARILAMRDEMELSTDTVDQLRATGDPLDERFAKAIIVRLARQPDEEGGNRKVFVLSGPDAEETLDLTEPVFHDAASAWTQGQRYVSTEALQAAESTSDL